MTIWYEAKPKEFDLPSDGEPVAYFLNKNDAQKYANKLWPGLAKINPIENPSHLEFIVKDNKKNIASFEFKSHAIKYNHEKLNSKGTIEPSTQ